MIGPFEAELLDAKIAVKGPKGDDGEDGEDGENGLRGIRGLKGDKGDPATLTIRGEKAI